MFGEEFARRLTWEMKRRRARAAVLLLNAALVGLSGAASAQDAGSLLREQERRQELQRLERLPDPQVQPALQAPESRSASGETIIVEQLRFAGDAALLNDSERAAYAAEAQDRPVSVAGLLALTDKITFALQQNGRLLARAVLPPQDVTDGTVTIEIIDGTLEGIEFQRGPDVRIREQSLRDLIERRVHADAVTKGDLESALLRMNDFPGVTASGRLQPGEAPNTSRLLVAVEETPIHHTTVWGDNYGDSSAGRAQATALLTLTDFSGRGERYHARASLSEGMKVGAVGLSAPLGASGVSLWGDYTYLSYDNVTGIGEALGLEGRSKKLGVGADYSVIRSRTLNLRLSLELASKALVDESAAGRLSDRRSFTSTLSVSGNTRGDLLGGALNSFSMGVTFGDLDLSRLPSVQAADAAGLQTAGHFMRVNGSFARVQNLPGPFSLLGRLYAQWADGNLDSSEDFSLGGPYGVRAYPVGEARGDSGFLGTLELRRDFGVSSGNLQLAGFADTGRIRINQEMNGIPIVTATGRNDYRLRGAGLSLRWTHQRVNLAGTLAHALGSNPGRSALDGTNSDGREERRSFWLQSAVRF